MHFYPPINPLSRKFKKSEMFKKLPECFLATATITLNSSIDNRTKYTMDSGIYFFVQTKEDYIKKY